MSSSGCCAITGGSGVSAPLYLMVGLAAFGTMNAVISGGARIAFDRSLGWTRQLRLTPLSPRSYLATKILAVGGLTALLSILGGVWFPINNGFLHVVAQALPSYWLVQASHVASGGRGARSGGSSSSCGRSCSACSRRGPTAATPSVSSGGATRLRSCARAVR